MEYKEIELPPNQVAFINDYVDKFDTTYCKCSLCTSKGDVYKFWVEVELKDCIKLPNYEEEYEALKEFLLSSRVALPETGKTRRTAFVGLLNNKLTVEVEDV